MNSYNYSAISLSRKCGKYYQYVYIDKLKPQAQSSGDMAFGSAIHLGIEACLTGDDGKEDFLTYWGIEKSKDNRYSRFGWSELRSQGLTLLTKFDTRYKKRIQIHQMEQRLYGSYRDIKLEGTPDVIGDFDGVPSIIDFKTSSSNYHKEKIRTAEQLYLYSYLAKTVLGYEVKQIVYIVLVKGQVPSIQTALIRDFKQAECDRVLNDIYIDCKRLEEMQLKKDFTRNLNSCIFGEKGECDWFRACFPKEVV